MNIEHIDPQEFGNPRIARGAFGEISLAVLTQKSGHNLRRDAYTYSYVALKTIHNAICPSHSSDDKPKLSAPVFAELAALRTLSSSPNDHENITPLLSIITSKDPLHDHEITFVFPYCPIDLHQIIKSNRFSNNVLSTTIIRTIFRDILRGLRHIHSIGILHCDMKPGNVLLSSKGVFQLADFGLAQVLRKNDADDGSSAKSHVVTGMCTLPYRPPELLLGGEDYKPSLDMWGAGLLLCEMLNGRTMFYGMNVLDTMSRIIQVLGTPTVDNWKGLNELPDSGKIVFEQCCGIGIGASVNEVKDDPLLKNFVDCMVVMDPAKRATADECLKHEWMKGDVCSREHLRNLFIPYRRLDAVDASGWTDDMKRHHIEQMKLQGAKIAMERRSKCSSLYTILGRKSSHDISDFTKKVKVSNNEARLLSSRMNAWNQKAT